MSSNDTRLSYLQSGGYRSGRMVKEDGGLFNEADQMFFDQRYSVTYQAITNGAVEITKRTEVTTPASPLYFAFDIPTGRRFVLFNRDLEVTEGRYTLDIVGVSGGWSGGTVCYKTKLPQGNTDTVETDVYVGVTPSGTITTLTELPLIETGSTPGSSQRAGGAAATDGVIKSFNDGENVLLRLQQTSSPNANYTASFLLIGWEEDDD